MESEYDRRRRLDSAVHEAKLHSRSSTWRARGHGFSDESVQDRRRRLDPVVHEAELHAWDQWPRSLIWMLGLSPLSIVGIEVGTSAWALSEHGRASFWDAPVSAGVKEAVDAILLGATVLAAAAPLLVWIVAFLRREHGPRTGHTGRAERHKVYVAWLLSAVAALLLSYGRPTMLLAAIVFLCGGLAMWFGGLVVSLALERTRPGP